MNLVLNVNHFYLTQILIVGRFEVGLCLCPARFCLGCVHVRVMIVSWVYPVQVTSLSELCLSGLRPVWVTSCPGCILSGLCHSICFGSCRSFKTKKPVTTFCLSIFHFNKEFNLIADPLAFSDNVQYL